MKGEGLEVAPEGRLPVPCVLLSARDRVSIHRHQLSPVQLCSSSLLSLSFFFFSFICLFIWLCQVSIGACRIFDLYYSIQVVLVGACGV